MHRKTTYLAAGVALIGVILLGAVSANAQMPSDGYSNIIQRIAQKFNLNESDVKAVFDAVKDERQSQVKANLENRLTQALKNGKITDAQKTAILNKFSQLKDNKPNPGEFKNLTPEQRKQVMVQKRTELENWAKENGLTLQTLQSLIGHPAKKFGVRGGFR